MIPEFPEFKSIEISDKDEVEKFTKKFPPYSDFNFTSMWSWDVKNEIMLSQLNNNLVLKFTDYITSQPFYTFIGISKINETADTLLELAKKEGIIQELKMVPEMSAQLNPEIFEVKENEDHNDYIFNMYKLQTYNGNRMRSKRNLYNRFVKKYKGETKILDHLDAGAQQEILELFGVWATNKKLNKKKYQNELAAFRKVFLMKNINLVCIGVYIEQKLCGFIVNEIMPTDYTILHFEKADELYDGVYSYLMSENARILNQMHKRTFLNYEQDLGLPGLRLGKKSYRPEHFLRKYLIKKRCV